MYLDGSELLIALLVSILTLLHLLVETSILSLSLFKLLLEAPNKRSELCRQEVQAKSLTVAGLQGYRR